MSNIFKSTYLYLRLIIISIVLLSATTIYAGDVTLSWTAPTKDADESTLTDLDGYMIYYGTTSGVYFGTEDVTDETLTSYLVPNLTDGFTYYFVVTAYDTSGNESIDSNEKSIMVNPPTPVPEISVNDSVSPVNDQQIPFGSITEGSTSNQTVTITNDGNGDMIIGAIAQSNTLASPFSIINDYCSGQTLSRSSNCMLIVRFTPTSIGPFSDSFDIPSNDSDEDPITINISGIGEVLPLPDITVTDSVAPTDNQQIPFGSITEGGKSKQTVTVKNDGNANMVIGNIARSNPLASPFSIVYDNCSGQTVSPSSNCTFKVRFSPATPGVYTDSFDIPSNDSDEDPITINISGIGEALPLPDITVTDSVAPTDNRQIPFGSITEGGKSKQTVTVKNDGNANMVIGNIARSNPLTSPFSIVYDNCSKQTISPSSNCTFKVRFSPATSGVYTDSFDIPSNDSDENPVTVSVNGTGIAPLVADITVTDSIGFANDHQMSFGNLTEGFSSDEVVTIANEGNKALAVGNIAQSNQIELPFNIINDSCSSQTLSPSSSCTLTVRFLPDTMGIYNDSFDIPSNDPDEDPVTITVSGTGLSSGANNLPSDPVAVYPANGQEGVGAVVKFQWERSMDPDQDTITYYLYFTEQNANGTYDFANTIPIIITFPLNGNVQYAGVGSYGSAIVIMAVFSVVLGIKRNKKKMSLLIMAMVMVGMLLASCGEIDDILGDIVPFMGDSDGGFSQIVSGLNSDSYCWKVVADDGNGGQASSDDNCFGT